MKHNVWIILASVLLITSLIPREDVSAQTIAGETVEVEGVVFLDTILNGNRDGGEETLSNMRVILDNCYGIFLEDTVTNKKGEYWFAVSTGEYCLSVDRANIPFGTRSTTGGDHFVIVTSEGISNLDFGFWKSSFVSQ